MDARVFVNFYEVLGLDPAASPRVIDRRFRELARRYHPDNRETADRARFDAVIEAHEALKDLGKRALYHVENWRQLPPLPQTFADEVEPEAVQAAPVADADGPVEAIGIDRDLSIQNQILTLLYEKRRRSVKEPGIGNGELERQTGCPHEHLEFHLWYLKEKGWVSVSDNGLLAITIDGVDRAAALYQESVKRRITDQS